MRLRFDPDVETPIRRALEDRIDPYDPIEDIPEDEARELFERVFGDKAYPPHVRREIQPDSE